MTKRKKDKKLNYLLAIGTTASIVGLYCYGKGLKIQDIFSNMFSKSQNDIDYNDPTVHAPIDYYIENSDGITTDENGNIKIGVWSAVKEALNNIFRK